MARYSSRYKFAVTSLGEEDITINRVKIPIRQSNRFTFNDVTFRFDIEWKPNLTASQIGSKKTGEVHTVQVFKTYGTGRSAKWEPVRDAIAFVVPNGSIAYNSHHVRSEIQTCINRVLRHL